MAKLETMSPIISTLDMILYEVEQLQVLLDKGFGDRPFRRKTRLIAEKATVLRATLRGQSVSIDPETSGDKEEVLDAGVETPVMVLGEDGEQRPATPEDLDGLAELGAPVGLQDSGVPDIDFGDNHEEVI